MSAGVDVALDALARLAEGRPEGEGRVRVDRHGAWAELVLDNPSAHHALSLGMMRQLGQAVRELRGGPEVALVLRSEGPAFCAGGDLREVRSGWGTPEGGRVVAGAMVTLLDALLDLPQVVVAAVDGAAIGGGAELTTAADHRVFGPAAFVEFRQVRLGVAAGWGGVGRLVQHVGRATAARWLLRGERVGAAEAERVGYGDPVREGGAREAALAWLEPVLSYPPASVRAVKAQLVAARSGDRQAEVDAFAAVWGGPAHRRALGLDDR